MCSNVEISWIAHMPWQGYTARFVLGFYYISLCTPFRNGPHNFTPIFFSLFFWRKKSICLHVL